MRILLADDHGLFLEGLQNLLRAGGYTVVGAAHDGLEALELGARPAPGCHPDGHPHAPLRWADAPRA